MASPRAFGLGPLETIVNVQWPSIPVYVTLLVHAGREGLAIGATPDHTATFTLSQAAIKAGAQIVLEHYEQASFFGDHQMFKLIVIKVPRLVTGKLFNLVLAGTLHEIDESLPDDIFCGTYEFQQTVVWVEQREYGPGGPGFTYEVYHVTTRSLTPDGETTTEADFTQSVRTPGDTYDNLIHQEFLSYYVGSELHNTGVPCEPLPTNRTEPFPFDVQMQINPIKDHIVELPPYPFDPVDAVHAIGTFGNRTSIWSTFLQSHVFQSVSGLGDCSIDFDMRQFGFSTVRKDKIVQVWPSTRSLPVYYNDFGPRIRLNKPLPNIMSPFSASCFPWLDLRFDPTGTARLWSGTAPPLVSFDPFT